MAVFFISRHSGAVEWAKGQGVDVDQLQAHLEVKDVKGGDVIIGTLPVNLVGDVRARGGRYFHLALDVPENMRGRELSAQDMVRCNARLEEFVVSRVF